MHNISSSYHQQLYSPPVTVLPRHPYFLLPSQSLLIYSKSTLTLSSVSPFWINKFQDFCFSCCLTQQQALLVSSLFLKLHSCRYQLIHLLVLWLFLPYHHSSYISSTVSSPFAEGQVHNDHFLLHWRPSFSRSHPDHAICVLWNHKYMSSAWAILWGQVCSIKLIAQPPRRRSQSISKWIFPTNNPWFHVLSTKLQVHWPNVSHRVLHLLFP